VAAETSVEHLSSMHIKVILLTLDIDWINCFKNQQSATI